MKKIIIFILIISLIITACFANLNKKNYIAKQINITIPKASIIEYMDSHGGFHGDGKTFAKIEFNNKNSLNILSQIEKNERWKELPLTENLNLIMYGGIKDNINYTDKLAEKLGIPNIENGYWYFEDRHSQSSNPASDASLVNRHSLDFTISMYDTDNNTLYYLEFDT